MEYVARIVLVSMLSSVHRRSVWLMANSSFITLCEGVGVVLQLALTDPSMDRAISSLTSSKDMPDGMGFFVAGGMSADRQPTNPILKKRMMARICPPRLLLIVKLLSFDQHGIASNCLAMAM